MNLSVAVMKQNTLFFTEGNKLMFTGESRTFCTKDYAFIPAILSNS